MTLEQRIINKITEEGPISFSEFMQMSLYDETQGFYSQGGAGRRKDFITSPEVGPLFGKFVAKAIDKCWFDFNSPSEFTFLECGAGTGTLAKSILRSQLECKDALKYITVETSFQQSLEHPSSVQVLQSMPEKIEKGIIFANELLDNLPFDIFESQENGSWMEVKIGLENEAIAEKLVPVNEIYPSFKLNTANIRVPIQRKAQEWLKQASTILQNGRIVIIDYAVEDFRYNQKKNWLRAYKQHEQQNDPLKNIGSSDITSDVDLYQLSEILVPTSIQNQDEWLRGLGLNDHLEKSRRQWKENAHNPDLAALEARSAIRESEALTDPSGLGSFKVVEWLLK